MFMSDSITKYFTCYVQNSEFRVTTYIQPVLMAMVDAILTNVRLQSCVDGVTDRQTQNGGANQDPPNGLADEDMTSGIPTGSKSHQNVNDISRSPKREQELEHT